MRKYTGAILIYLIISLPGCTNISFDGAISREDHRFTVEYLYLDSSESHEMQLKQGDLIRVSIDNISGSIDIIITAAGGEEIYRGNDAENSDFTVSVPQSGTYGFTVRGYKAKGFVGFTLAEIP